MINILEMTEAQWIKLEETAKDYIMANAAYAEAKNNRQQQQFNTPSPGMIKSFDDVKAFQLAQDTFNSDHNSLCQLEENAKQACRDAMHTLYSYVPANTWFSVENYRFINNNNAVEQCAVSIYNGEVNITQLD